MYIRRDGDGPDKFVGIHGWSGSHRTFDPLRPLIPENVTLYSLDLPGHGASEAPEQWDLNAISDSVVLELDRQYDGPFTLVGMCSGALISLFVAMKHGDRIDRLIVIDPFAYMPWYFKVFLNGNLGWCLYVSTFANPVGRWITNTALKAKRTENTDLTDSFATIDHSVTYGYLKLFATLDGIESFSKLSMPIDIAYGENTFGGVKRSLRFWQGMWPQANTWEMKGAGHLPLLEATDQVANIIFKGHAS